MYLYQPLNLSHTPTAHLLILSELFITGFVRSYKSWKNQGNVQMYSPDLEMSLGGGGE